MENKYKLEIKSKRVEAEDYCRDYRDIPLFAQACKACDNYGKRYGCPPFENNEYGLTEGWRYATVFVGIVRMVADDLPLETGLKLLREARIEMEHKLLGLEKEFKGMAFTFGGKCIHCSVPCARLEGKPCRNPELVRPSLESLGFDLGRTLSDIFGIEMKWGRRGKAPEYFTLVAAVFHN